LQKAPELADFLVQVTFASLPACGLFDYQISVVPEVFKVRNREIAIPAFSWRKIHAAE
jgi:hypothetical protein